MTGISGKNIVIAGGSSGIGLALALSLEQRGARVTVISRGRRELPESIAHIAADVLNLPDDFGTRLPEVIDGLVYAIGSINLKPFSRLTAQDFQHDHALNVLGAVRIIQHCLKKLQASESASIVLFSTVAVHTGMPYHASVASAKAAVEGLARSLAAEYSVQRIRVNVIAPSLTDTPLASALLSTDEKKQASAKRHPLGRYGKPDDCASAAAFLLNAEHSGWITGQVIAVDGGLSTLKPL